MSAIQPGDRVRLTIKYTAEDMGVDLPEGAAGEVLETDSRTSWVKFDFFPSCYVYTEELEVEA